VPFLGAACGRSSTEGRLIVNGTEVPASTPVPRAAGSNTSTVPLPLSVTPEPLNPELSPEQLRGFAFPIDGGCLPNSDALMPNAPRTYRNGIHEGIDWYPGTSCAYVQKGTPVHAMYRGLVIRSDTVYQELTWPQLSELDAKTKAQGYSDPQTLDIYRGRQVWIDHGHGIATRYAHLSGIPSGIEVGTRVEQGDLIGFVGESGTPESLTAPGTEMHLHAEVRVGDSFLGAGEAPAVVRQRYQALFSG
jgi:murein DD-endopeptidase MepM/ murein hydrolase activator NlpD